MGVGRRRRRGDPDPLGGGPTGHGDEQRRRTHRAGASVDGDRPGRPAGDPDGLPVRDEGRHDVAARLEAQGLEDGRGKPVANQELVARIDELLDGRTVEFRYVPAHQVDGDRLNDFADRAASQAASSSSPRAATSAPRSRPPSPDTPAHRRRRPTPPRQDAPTGRVGPHDQGQVPRPLPVRPLLRGG